MTAVSKAYISWADPVQGFTALTFDAIMNESWDHSNLITTHPVEVGADITDHVRPQLDSCTLDVFVSNEPLEANAFETPTIQSVSISTPGSPSPHKQSRTLDVKSWGSLTGPFVIPGLTALLMGPQDTPLTLTTGVDPVPAITTSTNVLRWSGTDFVAKTHALLVQLRDTSTIISVIGSKHADLSMVIETLTPTRDADDGTGGSFTVTFRRVDFVSTETVIAPDPTVVRGKVAVQKGQQNPTDAPNAQTAVSWAKLLQRLVNATGGQGGAPTSQDLSP